MHFLFVKPFWPPLRRAINALRADTKMVTVAGELFSAFLQSPEIKY